MTRLQAQPLPSTLEAILRAIDQLQREDLFRGRSIEISASRNADNSVKVLFSKPASSTIVADGRVATRPLFEVIFTQDALGSADAGKERSKKSRSASEEDVNVSFAHAVRAVCARMQDEDSIEFAVGVQRDGESFSVLVESIPYMPGGHTLYKLSRSFAIFDVWPGE